MNTEVAEEVMKVEKEVDEREMKLDDLCTQIIARRQPTASDLRLVMAISKATRDLERMGDEANKVAEMAIAISVCHSDARIDHLYDGRSSQYRSLNECDLVFESFRAYW